MHIPSERSQVRTHSGGLLAAMLIAVVALAAIGIPLFGFSPGARAVGWLLIAAGLAEILFGFSRLGKVRNTMVVAGVFTAAAGVIFIANPLARYIPVANVVAAWLLLRGVWTAVNSFEIPNPAGRWLRVSGAVDVLLSLVLVSGLPTALIVIALFGPTPEIIAKFSLVVATSFLTTSICDFIIAASDGRAKA